MPSPVSWLTPAARCAGERGAASRPEPPTYGAVQMDVRSEHDRGTTEVPSALFRSVTLLLIPHSETVVQGQP